MEIERVELQPGTKLPADYVGASKYADAYAGELRRADGSYYARTDRLGYYAQAERPHPAKTPLHIARWAVQEFTGPDDWVLDPTIGVGTTAVESLLQGRNVAGMEIQFIDAIAANIAANNPHDKKFRIVHGDARTVGEHFEDLRFALVVNNPPYSGDKRQHGRAEQGAGDRFYDTKYANLAFLRENDEFWAAMDLIYGRCAELMLPGARFVLGVKDMMRARQPFRLHEMFGDVLARHLRYEKMVVLKHHPPTLHLNTYERRFGTKPPLYQTILVFVKEDQDG